MELKGKVVQMLNWQEYTSKKTGQKDYKYSFVVETEGQYPKKVCLQVWGNEKYSAMNIQVGATYNFHIELDSHEWNGKWYNDVTAWRADAISAVAQGQSVQPVAQNQAPQQPATQPQPQQQAQAPQNNPQQVRQDPHPFDQIPPASASDVPF